ncbi:hypothetical protein H261_17518 [Paramagnetospirillum caucaseum]|uniref:Uncharacterized protein n=1 Tax=Paramagnetospirillum caucaseum TaxID=1244869 RepID=M2Y6E6_9PROT|nr:hypothetical protein H261_17518 [Paramagnetospirillum caucaseum]
MITLFCERRLASVLPSDVTLALRGYLVGLLARREYPPYRGTQIDFEVVAAALSIEPIQLRSAKAQLEPIFDAVSRSVAEAELRPHAAVQSKGGKSTSPRGPRKSVGKPPKTIVEFPEPLQGT